jgi:hypothetical protein
MIFLPLRLLVPLLPDLFLLSVPLLSLLGHSLLHYLLMCLPLLLLLLHIHLPKMRESLHHGVYLLLLLVHKHLLEGPLSGQVQVLEQVRLPPLVLPLPIIEHLHLLLGFEGKGGGDRLGDLQGCEHSLFTLTVHGLIVAQVLGVLALGRDRETSLFS